MKSLLVALVLFFSGPLVAQVADTFDPGAYVQVELILFTRELEGQGTNRTGVRPERLEKHAQRKFPLELISVRDAELSVTPDISWFEDEWALIEPRLISRRAEELALGLLPVVEEQESQDVGQQAVFDEEATGDVEVVSDVTMVDALPTGEQEDPRDEVPDETLSTDPEQLEEVEEPEELPLWLRYRNWYTSLISNCFAQIEEEEWKLAAALRSIQRSSGTRVIMHAAWIQPIGPRPQAVLLHGGEEGELGILSLRRQAFVQAEVSMWRPLAQGYAELHESRPMRLARAYYFDHPLIGAILRVDPIRVPPEFG